ncbi:MAG: hypothetical protein GY898_29280 [Proteobacteria bacterium]|nr:hypothetical protein [Pseudomonadota bacterium]
MPPSFSFTEYDANYEANGAALLAVCDDDPYCAARTGGDAAAYVRGVLDTLEYGECGFAASVGLDRNHFRQMAGAMLLWAYDERAFVPALAHRLERCEPRDAAVFEHFVQVPNPLSGLSQGGLYSRVLGTNIGLSELWEGPYPDRDEAEALVANGTWALGSSTGYLDRSSFWPIYDEAPWGDTFAETDLPVLAINGEFDPASTAAGAQLVGVHFDGPNQHYVELPYGSHSFTSPTWDGYDCGLNVFWGFLQDPHADLLDCTSDVRAPDFGRGEPTAQWLFGTDHLW